MSGTKNLESALELQGRGLWVFPQHSLEVNGECTCKDSTCEHVAKHAVFLFEAQQIAIIWFEQ